MLRKAKLGTILTAFLTLFLGCGPVEPGGSFYDGGREEAKVLAATETAKNNSLCSGLGNFYWEIGNSNSILVSGSEGDGSVVRSTPMSIASASKWIFAAYVLELRGLSGPSVSDKKFLTMRSGYTTFGPFSCTSSTTVLDCQTTSSNENYTAANDGKFFYGGGHYQKWAVDNSLSAFTSANLATEFRNKLGTNIPMTFGHPQLAGGIATTAAGYATFLIKVMTNQLRIGQFLGEEAVCTKPGSSGCNAVSSPLDEEANHYSYGHWVEDDPTVGDGTFSSAGALGFYPWIESSKNLYGVLAREQLPAGGADEIGNGYASMLCARKIRAAYKSGVEQ